jgi:hypothetical protein
MYLNTASRINPNYILLNCIDNNYNFININFEFNENDTCKNIIEELTNENLHFINYNDLYYFLEILLKKTRIFKISN